MILKGFLRKFSLIFKRDLLKLNKLIFELNIFNDIRLLFRMKIQAFGRMLLGFDMVMLRRMGEVRSYWTDIKAIRKL